MHPWDPEQTRTVCLESNRVLVWSEKNALAGTSSFEFWNCEEKEAGKPYDIRDGNVEKLWRYLRSTTTYLSEFEAVLDFASALGFPVRGTGIDVAAGVCWTTGLLSKIGTVEQLYALDFSCHRLLTLAPVVLKTVAAREEKIIRALGSFYDVHLSDASVDFCLMCQAFHHANEPQRLLLEMRRVLRPGGFILLIGENPIYPLQLFNKRVRNVLKMAAPRSLYVADPVYSLWPSFRDLYPSDPETGDHYYRARDYDVIFGGCGFVLHRRIGKRYTIYLAIRN
jgi:SAM-dependent methyltransferase